MPLDIGIGLLLALGTHAFFGEPFSWQLAFLGIASALLPDIDILTTLSGKWRHRGLTHYPLIYVPVIALVFFIAPLSYAFLFALGILAHFVHDTIGTGWGISWLWPFSDRRFLVLPDGGRRRAMGVFATWLPRKHPEWSHQGPHAWVRQLYFRPNLVSIIEFSVLAVALLTLAAYLW